MMYWKGIVSRQKIYGKMEYQLNKITFWQSEIVPLLKRNQFLILLENQRFSYIGEQKHEHTDFWHDEVL